MTGRATLVAAQGEASAADVSGRLTARRGLVAVVGGDGNLRPAAGEPFDFDRAIYVLDACVPADPVDESALRRLRRRCGTVVVAVGAEAYPDAERNRVESQRRLGLPVHLLGSDENLPPAVAAALEAARPEPPSTGAAAAQRTGPAVERADRTAYLRATIARSRATLLGRSAELFRPSTDDRDEPHGDPVAVRDRLDNRAREIEHAAAHHLREAYRGTFAGWPHPPKPPVVALPRPDVAAPPTQHRRRPEDVAVVILGASAGLGIGRAVAAPLDALGGLRWLALPVSLLVGLAAALWLMRVRRRGTNRAAHRGFADATTAAFRQRIEFDLAAALVAAESDAALRLARGPVLAGRTEHGTESCADASNSHGR